MEQYYNIVKYSDRDFADITTIENIEDLESFIKNCSNKMCFYPITNRQNRILNRLKKENNFDYDIDTKFSSFVEKQYAIEYFKYCNAVNKPNGFKTNPDDNNIIIGEDVLSYSLKKNTEKDGFILCLNVNGKNQMIYI